jgi:hypothetical protein
MQKKILHVIMYNTQISMQRLYNLGGWDKFLPPAVGRKSKLIIERTPEMKMAPSSLMTIQCLQIILAITF